MKSTVLGFILTFSQTGSSGHHLLHMQLKPSTFETKEPFLKSVSKTLCLTGFEQFCLGSGSNTAHWTSGGITDVFCVFAQRRQVRVSTSETRVTVTPVSFDFLFLLYNNEHVRMWNVVVRDQTSLLFVVSREGKLPFISNSNSSLD